MRWSIELMNTELMKGGGEREKGRKQKRRRKMKKYSLATRMIANWLTMTAGFTAISNYP
jgi:hypothetical protein